jgi:hypothetical protein
MIFRAVIRSADQEGLGGPRVGGRRTEVDATGMLVACGSSSSARATDTGSDSALGKSAADAEPQQNAQCDEAWLGEYGRGSAGAEPGAVIALRALRFAEQKSSNPGGAAADAYAANGASSCANSTTRTTPIRKRDLIAGIVADLAMRMLPGPSQARRQRPVILFLLLHCRLAIASAVGIA